MTTSSWRRLALWLRRVANSAATAGVAPKAPAHWPAVGYSGPGASGVRLLAAALAPALADGYRPHTIVLTEPEEVVIGEMTASHVVVLPELSLRASGD